MVIDAPGNPTVVCACATHVLCVRDFPGGPGKEYIVWRLDMPGADGVWPVSSGNYFPSAVWGGEFKALSAAMEAFGSRTGFAKE
jgi:hypothetical protein